jgi:hypothetical protein
MSARGADYVSRRQFSLRSLFFVTTVVCLCAVLVGVSPPMGIFDLPLALAALIGTIKTTAIADGHRRQGFRYGLFASFCRSLVIVLSLVVVLTSLLTAAGATSSIFVLAWLARAVSPLISAVRFSLHCICRFAIGIWQRVRAAVARREFRRAFSWARSRSMVGTAWLARMSRRLWRSYLQRA